MKRKTRFQELIALRLGVEDLRQLEAIAGWERTSVSAVIRRFIAEGLKCREELLGRAVREKGGARWYLNRVRRVLKNPEGHRSEKL